MSELKVHYQTKINKIRRILISVSNKFDRPEISDELLKNYMDTLEGIDVSLTTLEIEVQSLKYIVNNILDVDRNIPDEVVERIKENKKQDEVIEKFKPLMLLYYMMMNNQTENTGNTGNTGNIGVSEVGLSSIDDLD